MLLSQEGQDVPELLQGQLALHLDHSEPREGKAHARPKVPPQAQGQGPRGLPGGDGFQHQSQDAS